MTDQTLATTDAVAPLAATLCLLGGPYVLKARERVPVPEGSKRLLVFVALHGARLDRRRVAGALWPYGGDDRAGGSLRSALWRLRRAGIDVVEADKWSVWLRAGTTTDVGVLNAWAARLIGGRPTPQDLAVPAWDVYAIDLLPGWYEEWVVFERERIRQRVLHALETLSRLLTGHGRCAEAIEVAATAVAVEPLRESAQRALIEAHLAEGNVVEARRHFTRYRELLRRELAIAPSTALADLVGHGRPVPAQRTGLLTHR